MDEKEKLRHLLSHWEEHNREHAETYRKWAGTLRDLGLTEAAGRLLEAVALSDKTGEILAEVGRFIDR